MYLPVDFFLNRRTSPQEFLNRLASVEENEKSKPSGQSNKEREFSLPTQPKSALANQASMKKEKVYTLDH